MMYSIQKPSLWKRISAFLCDFILLVIVVTLFAFLLSTITGFDGWYAQHEANVKKYEDMFGIKSDISLEDYEKLSEEEKNQYKLADEALNADPEAQKAYGMIVNLTLVISSLSVLVAFLCLEMVVPFLLGNGQTLGKKIFGIALMRVDGVKVTRLQVFVRAILGKYTIETMVPLLILFMLLFNMIGAVGGIVLLLILALQIVVMIVNGGMSFIHDAFAQTIAVDFSSQLIFDSPEALLAYKERIHAEKVERDKRY